MPHAREQPRFLDGFRFGCVAAVAMPEEFQCDGAVESRIARPPGQAAACPATERRRVPREEIVEGVLIAGASAVEEGERRLPGGVGLWLCGTR